MCSARGLLAIFILISSFYVTESGAAVQALQERRSFALFSVHFNKTGSEARGGVCGTVFFIGPQQAVTAFHVVNAKTFDPMPGYKKVRIFLVHEGQPAIEIKREYVVSNRYHDLSVIRLPKDKAVDRSFVFQIDQFKGGSQPVRTEGFVANTQGPIVRRVGDDVVIASVPTLVRVSGGGRITRQAQISLTAKDLELRASPNIQLDYQPIVGISGGPVTIDGRVIAMNSFADPGTFKHTWALLLRPGLGDLAALP